MRLYKIIMLGWGFASMLFLLTFFLAFWVLGRVSVGEPNLVIRTIETGIVTIIALLYLHWAYKEASK